MPPKRKLNINTDLDESERNMYSMFQSVANYLSQFYRQTVNHQRLLFQTGEQFAYVKLQKWMLERLDEGQMLTMDEILTYLQGEITAASQELINEGQAGASGSGGYAPDQAAPPPPPSLAAPDAGQNEDTDFLDMQMDFAPDDDDEN